VQYFRHAVAAHGAPLVMVTFQPVSRTGCELPVIRDVLRRECGSDSRRSVPLGVFVVEVAGDFVASKKVVVDKGT